MPVLFVSGYGHGRLDAEALDWDRTRLLDKPFSASELCDAVAGLLTAAELRVHVALKSCISAPMELGTR